MSPGAGYLTATVQSILDAGSFGSVCVLCPSVSLLTLATVHPGLTSSAHLERASYSTAYMSIYVSLGYEAIRR